MHKKLTLFFIIVLLLIFSGCSKRMDRINNALDIIQSDEINEKSITDDSFSTHNEVNIQWQYRTSETAHELGHKVYELYLYNSKTNDTAYIISFAQGLSPNFTRKHFALNGTNSIMDCTSWYAGGGIGLSVFYLENILEIYEVYFEERQEPFLSSQPVLELKLSPTDIVTVLPEKELKIPQYYRELKIENPRLFGDDIRYLQAVINNFYATKIDVDGYYGPNTEFAVKKIQKEMKLLETGIVMFKLWDEITNTKEKYYIDIGQYIMK